MENENILGKEKVGKLLRMFSIPCVLSLVIQALYNLVDQIFIGHKATLGAAGNAATGVVYGITVLALGIGLWLGDGTAANMSLKQGSKNTDGIGKSIGSVLTFSLILSVALMALFFAFQTPILKTMGGYGNVLDLAKTYSTYIVLGFIFYILSTVLNPIIRADGSPMFAMIAMIIGAIINIVLDPIFLFVFNMDIEGAALATIIGQAVTFILSIFYLFKSKTFKLRLKDFILNKEILVVLKLGISSFLTQFAIFIITLVNNMMLLNVSVKSGYDIAITQGGITLAFKVFGIIISIAVGIAAGGQPIIGYNFGAGNIERVKKTFKLIVISCLILGIITTIIFEVYPQMFLAIFGDGGDGVDHNAYSNFVIKTFRIYLSTILLSVFVKVFAIFFQSIGKALYATIVSIGRDVVIIVPAAIILAYAGGVDAFLWSAPIADSLGFIITIIFYILCMKELKEQKVL